MSDRTILTLVRHGETPANLSGVWHGSTDSPLTERGRLQAKRVAGHVAERFPEARALYTSPLRRAAETADAIARALSVEPRTEAGIAEYDLGSWEEKTYKELLEEHRLWHRMRDDPDWREHGGESVRQVIDRFTDALRRIEAAHEGERVLVVTHGGALALALGALLRGRPGEWFDPMHNCAVSELVLTPRPELLTFNDATHLANL